MTLTPATVSRHTEVLWGWLRLGLGLLQIGLAAWAFVLLISAGVQPATVIFGAIVLLALAISRGVYGGRKIPPST